jgi:hypothetical protein
VWPDRIVGSVATEQRRIFDRRMHTKVKARRIAANVAKLPELVRKD